MKPVRIRIDFRLHQDGSTCVSNGSCRSAKATPAPSDGLHYRLPRIAVGGKDLCELERRRSCSGRCILSELWCACQARGTQRYPLVDESISPTRPRWLGLEQQKSGDEGDCRAIQYHWSIEARKNAENHHALDKKSATFSRNRCVGIESCGASRQRTTLLARGSDGEEDGTVPVHPHAALVEAIFRFAVS